MFLDELLKESHLGVGGNHEGVGGLKEVSGVVGDIGGFSGCGSGIVGGIGGFSGSREETAEGIGGKGVEFHDQHGGKVWRFVAGGDRIGGIGSDSSVDKVGPEDCRTGGTSVCSLPLKSCRHEVIASHMEMLKITIEDRRNNCSHGNQMCATLIEFIMLFMTVALLLRESGSMLISIHPQRPLTVAGCTLIEEASINKTTTTINVSTTMFLF